MRSGKSEGDRCWAGADGRQPRVQSWTEATMSGSVRSLDTSDSLSDSSLDLDEDALLAQQEWEESVEQLQKLLSFVLLPMAGKYFGRTFSYWGESVNALNWRGIVDYAFYSNSLR
jgi:hypothetical protein